MKIATWNVNSILARLPHVTRWLDTAQPDVLCMQETKCTDDRFPAEVFHERGYRCIWFGQQSYNGVAIASREECVPGHRGYAAEDSDGSARLLTTVIRDIHIINIYVPNGQMVGSEKYDFKLKWLKRLRLFFYIHYQPAQQ